MISLTLAFILIASGQAFTFAPSTVTWSNSKLTSRSSDDLDSSFHEVHWLDKSHDPQDISLGQAIAQGKAVVCIPDIASLEECNSLFAAGLAACEGRGPAARGRSRFSVSDPTAFNSEVVLTCDEMLLRALDHLDDNIPSIYDYLFKPSSEWASRQPLNAQLEQPEVPPAEYLADTCDGLRELYMMGELEWSEGEPAINVYETTGYFGAHKDHLALTVLIPLTSPMSDFTGGGTGFWAGNREVDENPYNPPDVVLKPPPGSALIFGGDVTHAGMPVEGGYRSVFVCSFSTRTPVSPEDRLHGMQAPPKVSANFKGTL
mmetsp:Transcript_41269/g.54268  ORF Transcript_41269/g.54268 Transcript_41269/m.54268 type:complete len:317 (+) Transcript_41269:84-1034(+)|eukprot:CAMPEP_0117758300 /NCGR_PEP_ID=MMETSP0947-20121206/15290_1 /TAXON_ID=44440 /ORGANISM="Chattonella subsalsa, Strain CCMP2191" /LENGTH=316 /DNA_ID=CAMNT_0005578449 /DNA_START=42 /DNA_END=992 /DNA_ORIENTATION=+